MKSLIVISRVKTIVKETADMNTSGEVDDALTNHVNAIVSVAIGNAQKDGRKTVMGRDVLGAIESMRGPRSAQPSGPVAGPITRDEF